MSRLWLKGRGNLCWTVAASVTSAPAVSSAMPASRSHCTSGGQRLCLRTKLNAMALGEGLDRRGICSRAKSSEISEEGLEPWWRGGPGDVENTRAGVAQTMPGLLWHIDHHSRHDGHGTSLEAGTTLSLVHK